MPTSHDVAKKAGVSQATVSRALRDQRGVSAETRARVRTAARDLGYVTGLTGRPSSSPTTHKVGVVSAALTNPFYPALIGPLQEALRGHGLQTVLITQSEQELLSSGLLTDGSFDGVILTTSTVNSPLPHELAARGIPFVLANRTVDGVQADVCSVDNRTGAHAVADLLVELGHERIGAVMGPSSASTARERGLGFAERLDELGVPQSSRWTYTGPFSAETGRHALEAMPRTGAAAPTAVFCGNDVIALGVLGAAASLQIRVPEDLTVIGFDDIPSASWGPVGLTTVRVELAEMAERVAAALAERLRDPGRPAHHSVLSPRLVARSTHARPPSASRVDLPVRHDTAAAQILRPWMSAVDGVARAVNAGHPRDAVLRTIAKRSCELIGFDYCAVMLAEGDNDRLSVAGLHGLSLDYVALVSDESALQIHPQGADRDSPAARAFRERRTIAVPDTAAATVYGRLSGLAPAQGYRSLLATPLKEGRRVTGLLVGYMQQPHRFSAAEIELAEMLAEQTSVVLHTARLRLGQQQVIDDLSTLNGELREVREQLEWAEAQHRRLMQLVLDGAGLEGLAQALSEFLGASITVEIERGRVLQHTVASIKGRESWTAPIVLSGNHVGRLVVTDLAEAPTPLQQRAIERFALVVGVEVLQRRHLLDVRERLSADLLTDLLRDEGPAQPAAVVERAAALGSDLTQPHTLALLVPRSPGSAVAVAGTCGEAVRESASLVGVHDGQVVMLIPGSADPGDVTSKVWEAVIADRPEDAGVAVVGQRVEDLAGYARAHRVARGVAELLGQSRSGVVDVNDAGATVLLLGEAPAPDLVQFAGATLKGLLDEQTGGDPTLLATLRAWMQCGCATAATATLLGVHQNTVTNRLRRIADLTDRDLQSFSARLDLQLALTVWGITSAAPR